MTKQRKVAIIGIGITKFGEHWDKGLRDLALEAGLKAVEDAGIHGEQIDGGYVGNMAGGNFAGQEHIGALLADYMGLDPIPVTRVEGACASGGLALRQGYIAVASGIHDIVAVGGVEKMTDLSTADVTEILGGAGDQEWELFMGATFPSLYALMMRKYMAEYGATEEQFASVAVKNHKHGALNPYAQYQNEITLETVMKSKVVASPIKVFDASPITDGAAMLILAPLDIASSYTKKPIEIIASAQASDTIGLAERYSLTSIEASKIASKNAYKEAGITSKDIQLAEVHDCFTVGEVLATEDLGFFKPGEGAKAAEDGRTTFGGDLVINSSGGLKAAGHPVGATGIKQAVEITMQFRGDAGKRQVKDLEYGLSHNVGGSGATAVVHIYKRA
ncbi:MAG: thiolase domain-containing protein [Candidatus Micrarchaeota archaeon]|nr:thiolase domain-containing protein [Candidatus Micrarchaeota archaeon]